ncbi:hypothetical protein [Amycolatopsis kentuckyensis]|uniref:hypothetical protein n=1 Tax=Amycolatopsis kentuckyensis TaxID=218823 RepID=UPI0011775A13|nr:hypothetical protein [Amycolatopsis kentuckyensis]
MTAENATSDEPSPALKRIAERASAAGIKAAWTRWLNPSSKEQEGPFYLRVDFPAGRAYRKVTISEDDAPKWERVDFARWTFLGDYDAILDRSSDRIMAVLDRRSDGFGLLSGPVPGTRDISEEDPDLVPIDDWESKSGIRKPQRFQVDHRSVEGLSIVVQKPPPVALRIACSARPHLWSVVLTGTTTARHDDALRLLREISTSFFIDLDMSYGVAFRLKKDVMKEFANERTDDERALTTPPRFPELVHNDDAASLYLYARSLGQVPLLEYLAYYQVLEFFMPQYARQASVYKLRDVLRDPRFDYNDEAALGRVIEMLVDRSRTSSNEREQLKATVLRCLEPGVLTQYLEAHPLGAAAMSDSKRIADVRTVKPKEPGATQVEQVSDRIYDLRCRIVHGKDGGNGRGEPLRPFGPESKLLAHDLALIRFVAQRVLLTSSGPASWGR